ncbi:MAG: cadherin-like domain-containing protein, partial [Halobacteriales archaeon]|nr:cadherin-like domain-containing protein [Halobacteriales archaeon]
MLPAGAQELAVEGPVYYLSVDSSTSLPGVPDVTDEDIVAYDSSSGTWAMFFDASDVGVGSGGLDAFHIREDDSILISASTNGRFKVPGLVGGPDRDFVDDSDLLLFTPTSTGEVTAGSFSFFFDGSDVGLDDHGEDIDGVFEFPDGSLGISTAGDYTVAGLPAGGPEDILRFTGSFGADTTGMWGLHFDGSDVGFDASVSLNGIFQATDLYFTTQPGYAAAGGSGTDDDVSVFVGTFGDSTSGTATLQFSPSTVGLDPSLVVDGVHVENAGDGGTTNSAPVALNDSFSTNEDTTLNVAAPGVLGNDSDADGDALTASLNTGVSNGSLTLNSDGSFTYMPHPDFNGTDSFTYDVSDGVLVDTATVTITVDSV